MLDTLPLHPDGTHPLLRVQTAHAGGPVVVHVCGELDLATAPILQREVLALFALPLEAVALDFAELTFIDSSGLNVLTRVRVAAEEHGVPLTLRRVPDQARRVLQLTGLDELFSIEDGRAP